MKLSTLQPMYFVTILGVGQTLAQEDSAINSATATISISSAELLTSFTSTSSSIESSPSISTIESQVLSTPVSDLGVSPTLTRSTDLSVSDTTIDPSSSVETTSVIASLTLTPSPTGSSNSTATDDGDEILPYGLTEGAEATTPIPPDVTTPEEHLAEEAVNKPQTAISSEDAVNLAIIETVIFEHFVNNAPAPADVGVLSMPANVSSCAAALKKRGLVTAGTRIEGRSLRGYESCKFVTDLVIPIYFHYIQESHDAMRPTQLRERIGGSFVFLNRVFGPLGITFSLQPIQYWRPPQNGANGDWSEIVKNEARLQRWQKQTRTISEMDLTIWAVNKVNRADSRKLNGYATFPEDLQQKAEIDGVVIDQERLQVDGSRTLVHEIGHWMGLRHTFGKEVESEADDCQMDDGLLRTTLTPGWRSVIFNCKQIPCDGGAAEQINNWMSYSQCRGSNSNLTGFHTDQKAAMFARYLHYRRGYESGECQVTDPDRSRPKSKRSSLQDLVDGQCPDIEKQVQAIVAQPTLDPADAGPSISGGGNGGATGGGSGGATGGGSGGATGGGSGGSPSATAGARPNVGTVVKVTAGHLTMAVVVVSTTFFLL